jgi:hypothetical protein
MTVIIFWGGSVISAGTIHDLRRVKVPAHFETPVLIKVIYLMGNENLPFIYIYDHSHKCPITENVIFLHIVGT